MAVSKDLVAYVKQKEGFRSQAYWDYKQWSYGYGQRAPGPGATITETVASAHLENELNQIQGNIAAKYSSYNWNPAQLDSMTSFAYNLGEGAVDQVTNNGARSNDVIAQKMTLYTKAGGVPLPALEERRLQESLLFNTGDYNAITLADTISNAPPEVPATTAGGEQTGRTLQQPGTGVAAADAQIRGSNTDDRGVNYIGADGTCYINGVANPSVSRENCVDAESVFNTIWGPTPNKFKRFSTMTYSISLYILSPNQYSRMLASGKKSVRGFTLFMQSAGINAELQDSLFGAKRSPVFDLDFYLDNFQFKSMVSGTATGLPSNSFELNFNVIEPAGLTFLERLKQLVEELNHEHGISDSEINYGSQLYLAVIRFYGYDAEGNLISGADLENPEMFSDPTAAAEKFIPFMMTGIQFRLTESIVEYSVNAVCPMNLAPTDFVHGRIPFQMELQGKTVAEVLGGTVLAKRTDQETEEELSPTTKPVRGLMGVLNDHQKKLVESQKYEIADQYEIEFEEGFDIANAKVVLPGSTQWARSGHPEAGNVQVRYAGYVRDADHKTTYRNYRLFSIQAGMSITQLIDLIVRTSSYISNQVDQINDENTSDVETNPKANKKQDVVWFKVTAEVELLGFDKRRNDYAYKIKYIVSPYKTTNVNSVYIPKSGNSCFGIHKKFDYWFTGENTEILNFTQDYNLLWYQTIGAHYDPKNLDYQTNLGTLTRTFYQTNSIEYTQGTSGRAGEAAASIASDLYSPGDQAKVQFEIIGDPDFIGQSEIFYSPSSQIKNGTYAKPFNEDGAVNYNASEIYFAINYNTVVDYNLDTSLADTTAKNFGRDLATGKPGLPRHSFVYRANIITTQLAQGKFTQILEGTLMNLPKECISALVQRAEEEVEEGKVTAGNNSAQLSNGPRVAPTVSTTGTLFPSDKPDIDILSESAQVTTQDNLVINNNRATDTPQPAQTGPANNQSAPVIANPNDPNSNRVNGDDEGLLSSIQRGARTAINTVGRITSDVFANTTPNNIDDFNDGG